MDKLTANPRQGLTVLQQLYFPNRKLNSIFDLVKRLGFKRVISYEIGNEREE